MTDCWADDFRAWHSERVKQLYPVDVAVKLTTDREAWMARESISCCADTEGHKRND